MAFLDKQLTCITCGSAFVFSSGEQEFFKQKGLTNEPKHCHPCRICLRSQRDPLFVQQTTKVNCENCGLLTRVPFQPKGHKPVYCWCCLHILGQYNSALEHQEAR